MRTLIVFLSCSAALLGPALYGQGAAPSHVRYQPTYDDVKSFLSLTDDQMAKLKQMQVERQTATTTFYSKMADKQKELNGLLENNSTDAAKIGQLMIDLQTFRKQKPPAATDIHAEAVALLTPEQKEKLARIEDAQKLRSSVDQALQLGLITPLPPPATAAPRMGEPGAAPTSRPATLGDH